MSVLQLGEIWGKYVAFNGHYLEEDKTFFLVFLCVVDRAF